MAPDRRYARHFFNMTTTARAAGHAEAITAAAVIKSTGITGMTEAAADIATGVVGAVEATERINATVARPVVSAAGTDRPDDWD